MGEASNGGKMEQSTRGTEGMTSLMERAGLLMAMAKSTLEIERKGKRRAMECISIMMAHNMKGNGLIMPSRAME